MSIKLFVRNALMRLRSRNDFPVEVSVLASQAAERLDQLAATLDRYMDREKGLRPWVEPKTVLYDELDQRFVALWNKLGELQTVAKQRQRP